MTKHVSGCNLKDCDCQVKQECIKIAKKYIEQIESVLEKMSHGLRYGDDFVQRVAYIESKVLTEFILFELVPRTKAAIIKLSQDMGESNSERRQTTNYH